MKRETEKPTQHPRPNVFFDIGISSQHVGRIVFELFWDITPKTCRNFHSLCTSLQYSDDLKKIMTYKGSLLHRVVKGLIIQGGDIVSEQKDAGSNPGMSIYGKFFDDENFEIPHVSAGLLSMANSQEKNTNASQFFVTLAKIPELDGKNVVFGRVISGMDVVERIGGMQTNEKEKPVEKIEIVRCGEIKKPRLDFSSDDGYGASLEDNSETDSKDRRSSKGKEEKPGAKRKRRDKNIPRAPKRRKKNTDDEEEASDFLERLNKIGPTAPYQMPMKMKKKKKLLLGKNVDVKDSETKKRIYKGRGRMKYISDHEDEQFEERRPRQREERHYYQRRRDDYRDRYYGGERKRRYFDERGGPRHRHRERRERRDYEYDDRRERRRNYGPSYKRRDDRY